MLADLIEATVTFVMSNYSLSFLVLGLIVSLVAIARSGLSSTGRLWSKSSRLVRLLRHRHRQLL